MEVLNIKKTGFYKLVKFYFCQDESRKSEKFCKMIDTDFKRGKAGRYGWLNFSTDLNHYEVYLDRMFGEFRLTISKLGFDDEDKSEVLSNVLYKIPVDDLREFGLLKVLEEDMNVKANFL